MIFCLINFLIISFENFVNPTSVVWQKPETKYWRERLKKLLEEYHSETQSRIPENILKSFSKEIGNFKQVCPLEMLDKLENPITLKKDKKQVS